MRRPPRNLAPLSNDPRSQMDDPANQSYPDGGEYPGPDDVDQPPGDLDASNPDDVDAAEGDAR